MSIIVLKRHETCVLWIERIYIHSQQRSQL